MPELFSANGNILKVSMTDEYDPGITDEIDRQIRHLPLVVAHCASKAVELKQATGSGNFAVWTQNQPNTARPRVYVLPINSEGIREELSHSVLLKSAMGMRGK